MSSRIVIVDAVDVDRRTIRRALAELPADIEEWADLDGARAVLNEPPADLVVIDQGYGLAELNRFLVEACRSVPGLHILLLGQEAHPVTHIHDAYVRKPFEVERLLATVHRLLE
ncbi:MAG: hypothetical protein ACM3S1_17065 [Hyphomicrobiales bacterium]